MLAAGKDWLPEARASLSRWSDDVSAPLAYSRALLAFVDWRNSMPTDDDDDDDGEGGEAYTDPFGGGSDGDDDDGSGNDSDAIDDINGEAAPELVPAFAEGGVGEADGKEADKEAVGEQDSDAEGTTGDAGEEDDEFNTPEAVAAAEAMADALGTNPYIGALLAILDDVTVAVEPADLAGAARARENPGYQGSVEEALAYIADAGICWVDRPGMEEFVAGMLHRLQVPVGPAAGPPRKCWKNDKYVELYLQAMVEPSLLPPDGEEE